MPQSIICPHCHNTIDDEDALLCHFCGESLNRAGDGFLSQIRYGSGGNYSTILWVGIVVVVILGFVLMVVF